MENSRTVTNPETSTSSSSREIRIRKKRMKSQSSSSNPNPNNSLWNSEKTQQIYSSKLLSALRSLRLTPPSPATRHRSLAVREAANTALAVAAKGRTRWSRAILFKKVNLKYLNHKHKKQKVNITGPSRLPSASTLSSKMSSLKGKGKELSGGVERKVKTLGRLVPACRKETLPVILEEATDYIPALEMQIRAMRELLSRFSAVSPSGAESSAREMTTSPRNYNETV